MGSVTEVEGVLTALQHALPPLGLELNLRKTTVWGPGLVPAASPLAAATRLFLEVCTELLGVPTHSPLYPSPVGTYVGALKGKFARKCAHALMCSCLRPAKVQYALRTLPIRHTAAFAGDVSGNQRATWDAVVGTPTSDAAWVQTTLTLSEGGCGVASGSNVAPVARLVGVMQFLARAEPFQGCDRNWWCPWPPRRECWTPSTPACHPPWNRWRVGRGRDKWTCQMETCDSSTGGQPA